MCHQRQRLDCRPIGENEIRGRLPTKRHTTPTRRHVRVVSGGPDIDGNFRTLLEVLHSSLESPDESFVVLS